MVGWNAEDVRVQRLGIKVTLCVAGVFALGTVRDSAPFAQPPSQWLAQSVSCVSPTVVTPTVVSPTVVTPTVVAPTVVTPTVVTPTVVTPTVVAPTVVDADRRHADHRIPEHHHAVSRATSPRNSASGNACTDRNACSERNACTDRVAERSSGIHAVALTKPTNRLTPVQSSRGSCAPS